MIDVALKEWAVVCDLLVEGGAALLLRKGGIHEDEGAGEFRMKHDRFALFPAWEHQKPGMIKERWRDRAAPMQEPAEVTLRGFGVVERIWRVPDRPTLERLDDLLVWTEPYLDMRFGYKPDHPLYLIAVRAWRAAEARTVVNDWTYGGCKSWVELRPGDGVEDAGAVAAMDDAAFGGIVERVSETFAGAGAALD